MNPEPTIYLVDDDQTVLSALHWMIGSTYQRIETYSSGAEFLASYDGISHGCVILDMRMPNVSGLDVQDRLRERGADIPVIVLTGFGEIPVCTKSVQAGAFDFIVKPPSDDELLERIGLAIIEDLQRFHARQHSANLVTRLAALTPREKEVMDRLIEGKSIKQIAGEFHFALQTAAKHRTRVLEKLDVATDIELLQIAHQVTANDQRLPR